MRPSDVTALDSTGIRNYSPDSLHLEVDEEGAEDVLHGGHRDIASSSTPHLLRVISRNVPVELQEWPHWVVWKLDDRGGGKPTKVPYQTDGTAAKSNDPTTWCSFGQAVTAYRSGAFDGIGFCFQGTPYAGVDLDDCLTNGDFQGESLQSLAVKMLDSYTEVSPSGNGLKIIVRGELPAGGRSDHKAGIEMYDSGRYFTVTGHRLDGTSPTVEDRTEQLQRLYEAVYEQNRKPQPSPGNDVELARESLRSIDPALADDHHDWIRIGMACHSVGEELFEDWKRWSQQSAKYRDGDCERRWASFGNRTGVTIGTLIHLARGNGWSPPRPDVDRPPSGDRTKSQVQSLIDLSEGMELFHDPEGAGYAAVECDRHTEVWPIQSKTLQQVLRRHYWSRYQGAPSSQALADAVNSLESRAWFEGPEEVVHLRVAGDGGDGETRPQSVIIDLGTEDWKVVVVTADGWQIKQQSPVRFRRAKGGRRLPVPEKGGSIDELQTLLNVRAENWPLVATWLLAALRPTGPYPILALCGEAGTGKSTTSRVLRSLVDPNVSPLRCQPKNEHDLVISAHNSWIVTLDNLSSIPIWLSDALCRLSTGGGFSTRTLYENSEEQLFNQTRPVIINGIDDLATRGDLVDRCLMVTLERIDEADRMTESEYWRRLDRLAPRIFGALLSAVAGALQRLPHTQIERFPRMADFAEWSVAGEAALGLPPGQFMEAYTASQSSANDNVIEASPIGPPLIEFLKDRPTWAGTATELLQELESVTGDGQQKPRNWPKNASGLSNRLRRIAPNLRQLGTSIEFETKSRSRTIFLDRTPAGKTPSSPSSPSPDSVTTGTIATSVERLGDGDLTDDGGAVLRDAASYFAVIDDGPVSEEMTTPYLIPDGSDGDDGVSRTQSDDQILMEF